MLPYVRFVAYIRKITINLWANLKGKKLLQNHIIISRAFPLAALAHGLQN